MKGDHWRLVIGAAILLARIACAQTVWSGTSTADAFVTGGPTGDLAGNNYGGAGALAISGTGASRSGAGFRGVFDSVLRFDLSDAKFTFDSVYGAGGWAASSVELRLVTTTANNALFNDNSSGMFSVVWMQDGGWTAGTGNPNAPSSAGITFSSLPGFLGAADETVGTFSFDTATAGVDGFASAYSLLMETGLVSDIVTGDSVSFELTADSNGVSYLFNSADFAQSARRPLLTITAVAVPEPSGLFVLGVGILWVWQWRRRNAR